MIPVGQNYRSEGKINARAIVSAMVLGTMTAIAVAFLVWAWELSPIPTLVILTPLIQGFVIGTVLAVLIGRLKLRHPKLMATVGFACGLASVGLIHYAHYLHFLDEIDTTIKTEVQADDNLLPEKKQEILANLAKGSNEMANLVLLDNTGHGGFVGSMMLRAQQGVEIKSAHVTGVGMWILWGIEALMVAGVATSMAYKRASIPYCEDCSAWCEKTMSPVVLAGESTDAFAEALRADDHQGIAALIDQPIDQEALGVHHTRAQMHSCANCDQTFADVENVLTKVKKGKAETKTKAVITRIRVSPAIVGLLRGPVVIPDVSPEHEVAEHQNIDGPAALEERDL